MNNITYLKKPSLFKTGFLPNDSDIRLKQGLIPQNNSNLCYCNNSVCNNKVLYPFPATQWYYDKKGHIPKDCDCAKYVKA
jgi:hypothetical protein